MRYSFMNQNAAYAKYKIGRYTYGDPRVEDCWNHPGVTLEIGSFCSIARGVVIWLGGNHHTEWISTSNLNDYFPCAAAVPRPKYYQTGAKGSVIIGNDVWIGTDVTILSGVTIGDGAVIGAKAVVAKSIPPYCVAVGNPAKVVRARFSEEQIQKLLKIKWWDWEDNKIKENIPLILSSNIDEFLSKFTI